MASVIIPSSVTSIGAAVFYGCENLALVLWDGNVPQDLPQEISPYNTDIFDGCTGLQKIVVCDGYAEAYKSRFSSYSNKVETLSKFIQDALSEIPDAQKAITYLTEQDKKLIQNYMTVISSATTPGIAFTNKNCALGIINLRPMKNKIIPEIEWNVYYAEGILTDEDKAAIAGYVDAINVATDEETIATLRLSALNIVYLREEQVRANTELNDLEAKYRGIDFNLYKDAVANATSADVVKDIINAVKSIIDNGTFATIGSIKYLLKDVGGEYRYEENITFTDKEFYNSNVEFTVAGGITYSRTFAATGVWQTWFVPFDVTVDKMKNAGMEVAKIAGVLMNEEEPYIAFAKMTNNDEIVKANTPYVVKANTSSVDMKLVGPDINIRKSTEEELEAQRLTVQSSFETFTFGGNYQPTNGYENQWYTLNTSGVFQKMGNFNLAPQRFWMTIDTRTDTPYYTEESGAAAKAFINMTVLGDDNPTGIGSLTPTFSESKGRIYNLQGQKVTSIQKGQVYIVNGKKFFAR